MLCQYVDKTFIVIQSLHGSKNVCIYNVGKRFSTIKWEAAANYIAHEISESYP